MLNKTCLIEALVGAGRGDPVSGSFDLRLVKIIAKINAKNAPLLLSKLPEDHDNSDQEVDVEDDGEEDGQGQEPVTVAGFHPALRVLKELKTQGWLFFVRW